MTAPVISTASRSTWPCATIRAALDVSPEPDEGER